MQVIDKYVQEGILPMSSKLQNFFDKAKDRMIKRLGYNVSYMKLRVSDQPMDNKGNVYKGVIKDIRSYGASHTYTGYIYTFPLDHLKLVYNYYKLDMGFNKFVLLLYCHELAHEVDWKFISAVDKSNLLKKLKSKGFTTIYLDSLDYKRSNPNKYDSEMLCEYMASVCVK